MSIATPTVRERPITFSPPMIRSLLAGRKTMMRRVCNEANYPYSSEFEPAASVHPDGSGLGWIAWWPDAISSEETAKLYPGQEGFACPLGRIGGHLCVRETWGLYRPAGTRKTKQPEEICKGDAELNQRDFGSRLRVVYRADGEIDGMRWRIPPHMPRWASRITLEITDIRVERVQSISEADAIAEGIRNIPGLDGGMCYTVRSNDRFHFNLICGQRAWETNAWVWCLTFSVVKGGRDAS